MNDPDRIPRSLGAKDYATVWDNVAKVREHAFELVDTSRNEEELERAGQTLAPFLVKGLGITREDVVFELGCGVARLGKGVAPHAREWWGLDVSANMVEIARERCRGLPNVRFFVGGGGNLADVPTASVDKMYCHGVFIHMDKEDWYSYLVDARRVLKPGGLFYFDIWNLCDPVGWLRWQCERNLYRDRSDRPAHRNQFSTPDEVRQMLLMTSWLPLEVFETFNVQAVATHAPAGADRAAFLADVERRCGRCFEALRLTPGDVQAFRARVVEMLRERGLEPETRPASS